MAKAKRFSKDEFIQQLDQIIEGLIIQKQVKQELVPTDVQVQDIANAFGVNSATLRRWSQECSGLSPRQYLATYRVERAKHMLRSGLKASQISVQLAFTEHKVFSTLFKRLEGMSPSAYFYQK